MHFDHQLRQIGFFEEKLKSVVLFYKMSFKRIAFILNIFDAIGYNTGSSKLSKIRFAGVLIILIQISLSILFILCQIYVTSLCMAELRPIEYINEILQYFVTLCTYLFIVMDSFCQRQKHRKFWKTIQQIDEHLTHENTIKFKCYIFKCTTFYGYACLYIVIGAFVRDDKFDGSLFIYYLIIKLCQTRVFYYVFCVEVLTSQFEMISNRLKLINNSSNDKVYAQQLSSARWHYEHIFELSTLLNDVFGWSQVALVSFSFYFLLAELNWICVHFDQLLIQKELSRIFF